ncbi:MAG: enoyl-CoA hydratase/isomerase family protein [Deltaproteobacteria bacterium]|nr:enoyl-CoA hydratase/isomerase family protein [Deltaproteobacteria bacterium]
MNEITVTMVDGGIALVIFDDPERPVNTMTPDLLIAMENQVVPLMDDPEVKGLVFLSAKPDTFIAGADIKLFIEADDPKLVSEIDGAYSRVLSRLFENPKPLVAAVHGAALGGGLEIALACHYILASDHPATVLGLPEVTLGILPAAGGTQRLPRRVGLVRGLDMMLTGRRVRAGRALKIGLVDEVVTPEGILERAKSVAGDLVHGRLKRPAPRKALLDRLIGLPFVRSMVLGKARKTVRQRTRGNYPAPMRILECVDLGLQKGVDAALEREIASIGDLMMTPQSRSLVWLFLATQDMKSDTAKGRPASERMAVVGGGLMGAGIASVSLGRCPVVVQDISSEALERCSGQIKAGLARQARAEAVTPEEQERRWSTFTTTRDLSEIAGADLVVEAVFEELSLKRKVLAEVEEQVGPEAVYGTNTSVLGISEIAIGARHPERVVGMHYFSPVHKMPLLELVVPEQAASWAVDKAQAFGQAQGKTVIRVKDRPGFYTTRILMPYLREALFLLERGATIEEIDGAMKDFGFPTGPLARMDEVGIDVAAQMSRDLGEKYSQRWGPGHDTLERMVKANFLGRKNGRGFYTYPAKKKKQKKPNQEIYDLFPERQAGTRDPALLRDTLSLTMVNEAAHCLQEDVIASPRDGDVGAVLGLGFPPFRGGPFHHADDLGLETIVSRMETLAEQHGPRYAPAQMIVDMKRQGKTFFV